MPLDQSNQYIADRRAWKEERQRLEAENTQLRIFIKHCLKQIEDDNRTECIEASILETGDARDWRNFMPSVWHDTRELLDGLHISENEQRAFNNGVDAGQRLSEYGELPY